MKKKSLLCISLLLVLMIVFVACNGNPNGGGSGGNEPTLDTITPVDGESQNPSNVGYDRSGIPTTAMYASVGVPSSFSLPGSIVDGSVSTWRYGDSFPNMYESNVMLVTITVDASQTNAMLHTMATSLFNAGYQKYFDTSTSWVPTTYASLHEYYSTESGDADGLDSHGDYVGFGPLFGVTPSSVGRGFATWVSLNGNKDTGIITLTFSKVAYNYPLP